MLIVLNSGLFAIKNEKRDPSSLDSWSSSTIMEKGCLDMLLSAIRSFVEDKNWKALEHITVLILEMFKLVL